MLTIVCDGIVEVNVDGAATCSTGWMTQVAVPPFEASSIDPQVVAAMFGAGFLLFFTPWAFAWGISTLLKFIRSN